MIAVTLSLFRWSSRVAWFGFIFMGQVFVQALGSSGVGTVEIRISIELFATPTPGRLRLGVQTAHPRPRVETLRYKIYRAYGTTLGN